VGMSDLGGGGGAGGFARGGGPGGGPGGFGMLASNICSSKGRLKGGIGRHLTTEASVKPSHSDYT
jgi:hypothetical protein